MDKQWELFARCKKDGSQDEWNELLNAIHPTLILALKAFCGADDILVEDFAQEVMLKIVRRIESCRAETFAEFRSWCVRICVRVAADHYRKAGVRKLTILDPTVIQKLREAAGDVESGANADIERLLEIVNKMENPCRQLLTLHHLHGMSYADIADLTGKSYDAVRMAISRCEGEARKKFESEA